MMDGGSERPTGAATTTTTSLADMLDHRVVNGDNDNAGDGGAVASSNAAVASAAVAIPMNGVGTNTNYYYNHHNHKNVPAVYCPLIDTSEDCLLKTSPPNRDRPGKCVRFNEQTENFYVPPIIIDGPENGDEDDDLDQFVDCGEVVPELEELDDDRTSISSEGRVCGVLEDALVVTEIGTLPAENGTLPVENGIPHHPVEVENGVLPEDSKTTSSPNDGLEPPVAPETKNGRRSSEDGSLRVEKGDDVAEVAYLVEEPDSPVEGGDRQPLEGVVFQLKGGHVKDTEPALVVERHCEVQDDAAAPKDKATAPGLASPAERQGAEWQGLQLQVAELGAQLSARVQEAAHLQEKVVALETRAADKSAEADKLGSELEASRKESEEAREKAKLLHANLEDVQTSHDELNKKLSDKLQQDAQDGQTLEALTTRVAELEKQLEETRAERAALEEALATAVAEVEAERDALEEALEEAMEDTSARFQKEFEELRTVHADREQQLLADLEWKLREVQAASKKKVDEKDRTLRELLAKVTNLEETASLAEKHAAAARAETEQLRGLNIEQQRALRVHTRDMEQLQVNEKVLKEEVARLRVSLEREKVHIDSILERHATELAETEREWEAKVEHVKKTTAEIWESRMHGEIIRLQTDLEQSSAEDKVAALHAQAHELTQDADRHKKQLQRRLDLANCEVETLTKQMSAKEAQLNQEVERLQTNADRDVFGLRRQLDRIDLKYQEQIEGLEKRHEEEVDKLRAEHERRMSACEQGYQLQSASTRATLELVKEQMRRESDAALQELEEEHKKNIEEQVQVRRRLEAQVSQMSQALAKAREAEPKQEQLANQVATLQTELKHAATSHKEALSRANDEITRNVRARETELAELRRQAEEEKRRLRADLTKEASERVAKLQQRVDALTAQLKGRSEDQAVIEDLRRTVVAKDAALERLRAAPRPEDANQMQVLKDSVTEHKTIIDKLRQNQAQAQQIKAALAEREKQLQEREALLSEKDAVIKERDNALRKSHTNPRPQDAQKLDELRKLLKEKDGEIHRLNSEELGPLRKKAQEAADREAELLKVRAEAVQVKESLKQVAELKKALGEKEEAIAKLGQQLSQRQREDNNKKLKQHASQIEELKKSLSEREAALAKAGNEVSQLQKSLMEKTKARPEDAVQIAALKKALAEKEKAVARLEAPRPEDAARIADLLRTIAVKDEEIGRLRETAKRPGDITEMQRAVLSRDDEIARLKDAVRARHGPHETELRRQLAEREAALNRLQEENRRIQMELQSKDRPASQPSVPTSIPVAAVQPQQQQKQQTQQPQQQPTVQFKPQTPPQQRQPQPLKPQQPQQPQQPSMAQPQQPQQPQQLEEQIRQEQGQPKRVQQQQPQKVSNTEPEERKRAVPVPTQSAAPAWASAASASRGMPWTREPLRQALGQATEGPGRPQDAESNQPLRRVLVQRHHLQQQQQQPQQQDQQQHKQTGRGIRRLSENVQPQQQRQTAPTAARRNSAVPVATRRETVLVSFPS